jgi:hypothetical protein
MLAISPYIHDRQHDCCCGHAAQIDEHNGCDNHPKQEKQSIPDEPRDAGKFSPASSDGDRSPGLYPAWRVSLGHAAPGP